MDPYRLDKAMSTDPTIDLSRIDAEHRTQADRRADARGGRRATDCTECTDPASHALNHPRGRTIAETLAGMTDRPIDRADAPRDDRYALNAIARREQGF